MSMTLRQRRFFKKNKLMKEPRGPGIWTGRILMVKQQSWNYIGFPLFSLKWKSGWVLFGCCPQGIPKPTFLLLFVCCFLLKFPMLLKNKTMWSNMCSEDVPAPSHGIIMSPAQERLGKPWQPIIFTQEALDIFAVIFGPMPTSEPCYSDHFRHTGSASLAIAQALVALWSP